MNRTVIRILSAALSLLCLLSFAACGGGDDETETTDNLPPLHGGITEKHRDVITDFVTENRDVLEDVVDFLADEEGLSFYYFTNPDEKTSQVEKMIPDNGSFIRQESDSKVMKKLAELRFTGEVTHSSNAEVDCYSFYTYMHKDRQAFYFVYCADPNAMEYLSHNFLHGAVKVTVAPITTNWYYVESN